MHLGMVVQWEDRFHAANRAHTYLGPIDHPEAIGQGDGIAPDDRYPDFVAIAEGFGWQAAHVSEKSDLVDALQEMIDAPGPLPARRAGALPGARAADDPLRDDGQGLDPGIARRAGPTRVVAKWIASRALQTTRSGIRENSDVSDHGLKKSAAVCSFLTLRRN